MATKNLSVFRNKLRRRLLQTVGPLRVKVATRHLSGPERITLAADEVVVVCMLRNAAYYLEDLLRHHRQLGVRHFIVIDNGSTDETVQIASRYQDISVVANHLPVGIFENLIRATVAQRVVSGGWFLFVDGDELIEICHGEGRQISEFTSYCNARGYDAVIGHYLDMFGPLSLSESAGQSYQECIASFDRYSLSAISKFDYFDRENISFWWDLKDNSLAYDAIKFYFGGIRREVFGENPALTAHRLVRNHPGIRIYTHAHCASRAVCADFTLVLRHYKFAGPFLQRELAQVQDHVWVHGEDERRVEILRSQSDMIISGGDDRRYRDTAKLVDEGFLVCSDEFKALFPPLCAKAAKP